MKMLSTPRGLRHSILIRTKKIILATIFDDDLQNESTMYRAWWNKAASEIGEQALSDDAYTDTKWI